jgi:hypothetical protein
VKSAHIVNQSVSNDHIASDAKIDFEKLDISRTDIESLGITSGTIYTAGENVSISDTGEISSVDTNTTYTAGTNISIDSDNVISAVDTDTDTNTTYTLSFSGTTLTLTDSAGVATDIDLASIDTDTDTTYSVEDGLTLTGTTIAIDNTVVTSNYAGSIVATAFTGDGSGLTNVTPADGVVTSEKIDSSVGFTSSYSVANTPMVGANSGYVLSMTNSSTTGNSSSTPMYIMGKGSVTNWGPAEIEIPYTLNTNSLVYITRTSIDYMYDASAILTGELDLVNNTLIVRPSANTGSVETTFNFMIINFDY